MADQNQLVMTSATSPKQIEKALKQAKDTAISFVRQRMTELNAELDEWNNLLYRLEGDN